MMYLVPEDKPRHKLTRKDLHSNIIHIIHVRTRGGVGAGKVSAEVLLNIDFRLITCMSHLFSGFINVAL